MDSRELEETSMEYEEKIIQKTSDGWYVTLSKDIKGSLILTNKRLIIGDSSNSIYLKEIKKIDVHSTPSIKINLKDRVEHLIFKKGSIGHAVDTFAAVILATPFETISGQEVSSYTSYWASILTMAIFQYGHPDEFREEKHEDKKAWCYNCQKYVNVPWTRAHAETPIWKLSCPECGRKPLATLSPEDRRSRASIV